MICLVQTQSRSVLKIIKKLCKMYGISNVCYVRLDLVNDKFKFINESGHRISRRNNKEYESLFSDDYGLILVDNLFNIGKKDKL